MADGARWPARLALLVTGASALMVGAGIAIHVAAQSAGRPTHRLFPSDVAVALLYPAVGWLVLRRDPRNRTGWVLLSGTALGVSVLCHQWAYDAGTVRGQNGFLVDSAAWLSAWTYWPYFLMPTLLPVLFPSGRSPSDRWRRYCRAVLGIALLGAAAAMFKPDSDLEDLGLTNPLGIGPESALLGWVAVQVGAVALLGLVAAPLAIGGLALRQRRATGAERAQLLWLLLGFTSCLLLGLASSVLPWNEALFTAAFCAIPLSIAVAVLRHGMLDVEVVVNTTIVYGLLTSAGVLLYAVTAAAVARFAGADGLGPLVAALVVALAAAARSRLQSFVTRRLFGARHEPYAVVQQVSASLASAQAPQAALHALVEAVRSALRLPFVQVLDTAGGVMSEAGNPVAGTHVLRIVDRGRERGLLVVGRRHAKERLGAAEESALRDVAQRAGALMHAQDLTADLQKSYAETVRAREEERRRLRRDLHDGVGPSLAGMALQLESLERQLQSQPELAARAATLRDRLRGTVGEVRTLVDGLRPAALDELGLARALETLSSDSEDAIRIDVRVELPDSLPAAVEVAAYRIANEAVANVVRHSHASSAQVSVTVDEGTLLLTVCDDGCGFGPDTTAGVGLDSLHERAREVGGVLHVDSEPGGGTTVRALLPLAAR